jgi:ABC-type uncharacterized transport system substrate-binding protein
MTTSVARGQPQRGARPGRRGIGLLLAWLGGLIFIQAAWAYEGAVWVATSGEGAVYTETVAALGASLRGVDLTVAPWRDITGKAAPPRVVVAVGMDALRHVAVLAENWPRTSVVALLVPRHGLELLQRSSDKRLTGVYLDQPFLRQMQWLRAAMPGKSRVGVLLGPTSKAYAQEIRQAARQAGLDARVKVVEQPEDVAMELRNVLNESDVFLAVPDGIVFSSQMTQYILMASYRHGVPLVGYSAPLVKAGAIAALVASPSQIGRQGAALVMRLLDGSAASAAQAPDEYEIKVNPSVARSFDLSIDDGGFGRKARADKEAP